MMVGRCWIPFKDAYFSGFISKTLGVYEASFFGRMVGNEIEQSLWFGVTVIKIPMG